MRKGGTVTYKVLKRLAIYMEKIKVVYTSHRMKIFPNGLKT